MCAGWRSRGLDLAHVGDDAERRVGSIVVCAHHKALRYRGRDLRGMRTIREVHIYTGMRAHTCMMANIRALDCHTTGTALWGWQGAHRSRVPYKTAAHA